MRAASGQQVLSLLQQVKILKISYIHACEFIQIIGQLRHLAIALTGWVLIVLAFKRDEIKATLVVNRHIFICQVFFSIAYVISKPITFVTCHNRNRVSLSIVGQNHLKAGHIVLVRIQIVEKQPQRTIVVINEAHVCGRQIHAVKFIKCGEFIPFYVNKIGYFL